jgi:rieske iron-sulfur protein
MPRETDEDILTRQYPRADDGADQAMGADLDESQGECQCRSGDSPGQPSIKTELYKDRRAELERRDYAKILATIGGLTALGSLAAPIASLTQVFERGYAGPVYSDGVALVDADGQRIGENRLSFGEFMTVFPEPRPGIDDAPTLLVRFPEEEYGDETNLAFTVAGYAAYSKVCTHAGCMVSDIDNTTLVCPCHSGRFNPLAGATVTGGPPPRPLPQLPITLSSDGDLLATGDFEGAVGPGGD